MTLLPSRMRILPRQQGAAPLDVVIGVMAFMAALALGASLVADRAAQGWRAGLSGRLTVQILPPVTGAAGPTLDRESAAVVQLLIQTPGIVHAAPISQAEAAQLVAPWLGSDALVADLPMPRLIDATLEPGAHVDVSGLRQRLRAVAPDATLDDHSRWVGRLKRLTNAVIWTGYGILLLIGVATTAAVSFATRAGLLAHHEIVSLLHQMGAHDSFIARSFERHFFLSALAAATIGTVAAAGLFLLAGGLEMAGLETVPFLPPIGLKYSELPWLIAVPVAASLIAWVTARLSVLEALRKFY